MKTAILLGLLGAFTRASDVALVIGGYGASDSIEVVTRTNICQNFVKAPIGRQAWTAQYVDNAIHLCGGTGVDIYDECYELIDNSKGWTLSSPMTKKRRYHESIVFNGQMVILGGYNGNEGWLDSVEKKLPSGIFQEMSDWKMPRKMFDLCAVQMNNTHIMVLGGNVFGEVEIDNVIVLNTETNTWTEETRMAKERAGHDCMNYVHNGEEGVLVSGGCSNNCQEHLKDVDFYGFTTKTWVEMPSLTSGRRGHKMLNVGGDPTVIGGYYMSGLNTVETFDIKIWTQRPDFLSFERSEFASPDNYGGNAHC